MLATEPAPTLERVHLLLTPAAVDDALANRIAGVEPVPSELNQFYRDQIDSSFGAPELTIIMRKGRRDARFADGKLPVYGDIQRLPNRELSYVSRRDINPATVVEMNVDSWDNYSLGFQLLRGATAEARRSARVAMNKRSLMLGDLATLQLINGIGGDNLFSLAFGSSYAALITGIGIWIRRHDRIHVRAEGVSAPMARYYNNFTVL